MRSSKDHLNYVHTAPAVPFISDLRQYHETYDAF